MANAEYDSDPCFVETFLPKDYIYLLGLYVQTCAQIEFYACSTICKIEGHNEGAEEWQKRHDELRNLSISKLISTFGQAATKLDSKNPKKKDFNDLAGWLHRFSDNRHIAIHGRHYSEGTSLFIDAAPRKSRTSNKTAVGREEAKEAIEDADRILKDLVKFCET